MDWATDSATWPLTKYSRFVLQKPHRWHLQDIGEGPLVLLIHGAGGSTHSWQHLIPYLIKDYRVVAIDLPGQGFTQCGARHRCGLDAMAEDILALCLAQDLNPYAIIGHSAGAAIALRLSEMMPDTPRIVGINAALDTFQGVAGVLFPVLAKAIAALPMAASLFSATMSKDASVARIINGTGSTLTPEDLTLYRRLVASSTHVNATLNMMAQWKLEPLIERLPKIKAETVLVVGDRDTAVPHMTSIKAAGTLPNAVAVVLKGLGHLAHEQDAATVAKPILQTLAMQHHSTTTRTHEANTT